MEAIQYFKGSDSRVDGRNLNLNNVLYLKFDGSFGEPQKLEENDFYTSKANKQPENLIEPRLTSKKLEQWN
jgi:hypothetical protein